MSKTTLDDATVLQLLTAVASKEAGGHLTILKFSGNWRVAIGTPDFISHGSADGPDEASVAIAAMPSGPTLAEAAVAALKAHWTRDPEVVRRETDAALEMDAALAALARADDNWPQAAQR
jgi:hypothetical protein